MRTFLYWFTASNGLLRKTSVTAVCLFFGAVVPGCGAASEAYVPLPPSQPIPMDGTTYEWIGRQALAQYGYEEIIKRGVQAGFLRYPDSEQTNTRNFVGQTMAEAARQAWPVFTQGAVTALLTSQLDSPAPGLADVVALGMLVVAIAKAGSVVTTVLTSSTTATATPVPTATPIPTAKPTTTTTAPPIPIALPRRWPGQTCENAELDRLGDDKKRLCDSGYAAKCTGNVDKLKKIPCSAILLSVVQRKACLAARWVVQDKCFGGKPDARHEKPLDETQVGIDNCEALQLINCAKGHPQAGL